jgi:hypothetical protein
MAYTNRADIYLGDASSQVYEFMLRPRPCIFLNPNRLAWRDDPNFAHWQAGRVIETAAELAPALATAQAEHAASYRRVQRGLFDASFDLDGEPSSVRAARALARFCGLPEAGLQAPCANVPRVING